MASTTLIDLAWGGSIWRLTGMLTVIFAAIGIVLLPIRPFLLRGSARRALRSMGFDVCVPCGYVLDGIPIREHLYCPECGTIRHALRTEREVT